LSRTLYTVEVPKGVSMDQIDMFVRDLTWEIIYARRDGDDSLTTIEASCACYPHIWDNFSQDEKDEIISRIEDGLYDHE